MIVSGPVGTPNHLKSIKEVSRPKTKSKLQIPGLVPVDYESGPYLLSDLSDLCLDVL